MSSNNTSTASFKPFFIKLSLFSVISFTVVCLWEHYTKLRFYTNLGWFIVLFFMLVSAFTHVVLTKAAKDAPQKFITYFMTITGIRLFGYLSIILVYAVIKREAALGFTLLFLLMYFLYSAFEVATLLHRFKK